jgi:hypothetical protein
MPQLLMLTLAVLLQQACTGGATPGEHKPGETDFTTVAPSQQGAPGRATGAAPPSAGAATGAAGGNGAADTAAPQAPGAPGGRIADVQEADIYRVDHNRLFYLNTYRGFVAYDVNDAQHPKLMGRLPVYGYPVEMFVQGTTVYALLSDVLYLTQDAGQLSFQRRNVSQLVTIDVADPANPKLLNATDIVGQLREGVSRKIDNTIYVVSYQPQSYWYGWQAPGSVAPKEQAWVYSFNVADAKNPALVKSLQVFEGGSVNYYDNNSSYNRWFQGVTIAATSNALMVVENWYVSAWNDPAQGSVARAGCGSYESDQRAHVSIIDVSDPAGTIRKHTDFWTSGSLGDQFKQTYVFDPTTKTGTYYGIFTRNVWSGAGCTGGTFRTQNALESWDVTDGTAPNRLARLDFGKDQETVRGTSFDVNRNVVFAITARQIDPLYAISIADRNAPKILSSIDGLSGDMTVFRGIANNQFLLGIGRDNSGTCTGTQDTMANTGPVTTNVAVSIIDVRDLTKIRLAQRRCVAIDNAAWVGSDVTWNLDQAHKMIGMFSDDTANVITVPVYYWKKTDDTDSYWWYGWETAVGIMSWDVTAYDPAKAPEAQSVLKNYGTFVHPNGQVLRSIVFQHEGATPERMMINLSDTHISVASLQDLAAPKSLATVEVAPFQSAVLRFGDYVVEEVQSQPYYGWSANQDRTEFRVKTAGGDIDQKTPVATFALGQVARVFKHGEDQLVAIRYIQQPPTKQNPNWVPPTIEAQVYDLKDPAHPRKAGKVQLPNDISLYYGYWCGDWFWGAYGFYGAMNNVISTTSSLVILGQSWQNNAQTTRLISLDLTNADAPTVSAKDVETATTNYWEASYGLVPDPVDQDGFYLTYRKHVGDTKQDGLTLAIFKDFAQRWDRTVGGQWAAGASTNLPGRLTETYADAAGKRMFLAQDYRWFWVVDDAKSGQGHGDSTLRLSLLREAPGGKAELLDSKAFDSMYPSSMAREGQTLMMVAHHQGGYYYGGYYPGGGPIAIGASLPTPVTDDESDRLVAFDLSGGTFATKYDAPTGMYNSDLVGVHDGRLLVNLSGDGFLVVDVADPAAPRGVRFVRTLGWSQNVEFAGSDVYASSGYFGVQHFKTTDAPALITSN